MDEMELGPSWWYVCPLVRNGSVQCTEPWFSEIGGRVVFFWIELF